MIFVNVSGFRNQSTSAFQPRSLSPRQNDEALIFAIAVRQFSRQSASLRRALRAATLFFVNFRQVANPDSFHVFRNSSRTSGRRNSSCSFFFELIFVFSLCSSEADFRTGIL